MIRRLLLCILAVSLSCSGSANKPGGGAGSSGSAGANGQAGGNATAGANGQAGGNATAGANGQAGSGAAGNSGTAGSGVAGSGAAGSSVAGSGNAGSGAAGIGAAGIGAAGSGAAGAGTGGMIVNMACGKLLPLQTSESVLQRGKNSQRTAHFVEAALTVAAVGSAKFGPDATFNAAAKFTGGLEGVPLFVAGSAPGKGMFIVASRGGGSSYVTALDETSGATLWSRNMGASGNGVRSTPVIDAATGTIYTAFDATTGVLHHEIHALSIANMGAEVAGWPVDISTVKSTNNDMFGTLPVAKMIQRGALSLVNGILYVPYGGVFGDAPPYKGFVVAVNVQNPATPGGWSASGDRSGIWSGGGLASDGTSIFANTGNGGDATHMDSEEVVRITGMGVSSHTGKDAFFPSSWKAWDGQDNDVGSSSPQVLQFSGTCQSLVVAPSKPGHLFLLDPNNLGGADGSTPLRDFPVGNPTANGEYKVVYAAPAAYISASGVHVALEARLDAKCPNGGGGDQLMSILLDMSTTPATPKVAWCAPVAVSEDRHSPIATSTDGLANAIVWFVVGGGLKAYDGDTGTALFSSAPCGNVQRHTSSIAANGRVIVGADGKLCSYSVQP
jgi:hypothetical protein